MKSLQFTLLLAALFLWSCRTNTNLYKNGVRDGRWRHETSSNDYSKGRYSSGKMVGRWKTVIDGRLYRKARHKGNSEIIKLYHPNGKLKARGRAQVDTLLKIDHDTLAQELHWYYTGKWYQYGPNGKLLRVETYDQGKWIDDPWSDEDSVKTNR